MQNHNNNHKLSLNGAHLPPSGLENSNARSNPSRLKKDHAKHGDPTIIHNNQTTHHTHTWPSYHVGFSRSRNLFPRIESPPFGRTIIGDVGLVCSSYRVLRLVGLSHWQQQRLTQMFVECIRHRSQHSYRTIRNLPNRVRMLITMHNTKRHITLVF